MFTFTEADRVSNMSNNELVDHVLNNPIASHMDAVKRLVENRKLVARFVIEGRFYDTNEPFELERRSSIYPTTEQEKIVIHLLIGH